MSNQLFTELENITEKEFFRRELGIEIITVKTIDEINTSDNLFIATNNPGYWLPFLEKLKENSCVFFLIGNETYDPEIFNSLNNIKALRHVFVYNMPTKIKKSTLIKTLIGNIIDVYGYKEKSNESAYRDFRNSMYLIKKFNKTVISYPHSRLPQGYSNNFAYKLSSKLNLSGSESLLTDKILSFALPLHLRSKFISFSGQPTNRKRKLMIFWAQNYMDEQPDITEGFRGLEASGDLKYIDQLFKSKFILVPPGSFNNSNHRYTESLICGSIPLILAKNSIDPSENNNWTNEIPNLKAYSAKLLLKYASKMDINDLEFLLSKIRRENFDEIYRFKDVFQYLSSLP